MAETYDYTVEIVKRWFGRKGYRWRVVDSNWSEREVLERGVVKGTYTEAQEVAHEVATDIARRRYHRLKVEPRSYQVKVTVTD